MPALILLADDSPLARRMGSEYLTALGYDVRPAASREEAWLAIEESEAAGRRPELVLAAASLSGGEGRELARRLKADARWSAVPVILMIGALAAAGEFAPADGVLRKPLSPAALEPWLEAWLQRSPSDLLRRAVREAARGRLAVS